MVDAGVVVTQFMNGLAIAMLLMLVVSGFTIIFGLMDIINFAHGSLYMLGAYFGYTMYLATDQFLLAILAAFIGVAIVSGILEVVTLRPLHDRDPVYYLLITFGYLLILDQGARLIWGSQPLNMSAPDMLSGSTLLLGSSYPVYRIFIFVFGLAVTIFTYYVIDRTDLGLIIRAGTYNAEMTRSLGINLPRVFTLTFALGAGLAGLSGVIAAPMLGLTPTMGADVIIDAFIIVIIGGLGSLRGAFVAAIIIAEVRTLGALVAPDLTPIMVLVAMILVLTVRPEGIFGFSIEGESA